MSRTFGNSVAVNQAIRMQQSHQVAAQNMTRVRKQMMNRALLSQVAQ